LIPFTKAHACGNDFLIVNQGDVRDYDLEVLTQHLCDRNTGIGADGVEYFEWLSDTSGRIHLRNADGSIAEISGNGTRCVAAWMAEERNAQPGDTLSIETDAGARACTIQEFHDSDIDGPTALITTNMGEPEFEERTVELSEGTSIEGVYVSMGNPHFVVVMPQIELDLLNGGPWSDVSAAALNSLDFSIGQRPWEDIGAEICQHPDFPDQTNVEFVHLLGSASEPIGLIALRIFERGVGPTSSSGTGTSAAATAAVGIYHAAAELEVIAPGGAQTVRWNGPGTELFLTGPATLIARGEAW
jgi:diaminopimelate epimerase